MIRDRENNDVLFNWGVTKFEYFIAAALQTASPKETPQKVAQWAVEVAREVLLELEGEPL